LNERSYLSNKEKLFGFFSGGVCMHFEELIDVFFSRTGIPITLGI